MPLFDGLTGCQAGGGSGGVVTEMKMVRMPKRELDAGDSWLDLQQVEGISRMFINKGCQVH